MLLRRLLWGIIIYFIVMAVLLVIAIAITTPAHAQTGPFTWSGHSWCPSFDAATLDGCNTVQHNNKHLNVWNPSQVTVNSEGNLVSTVAQKDYTLNGVTYHYQSGAVNIHATEAPFRYGDISARLDVACAADGSIEDWPAFVISGDGVGNNPPWPASGEIDVLEGLRGDAAWHYHYVNAAGQNASIGAAVPGSWCGWHTFGVSWTVSKLQFRYDGVIVGTVTQADIGVPVDSWPKKVRIGLGVPDWFTPVYGDAVLRVSSFVCVPLAGYASSCQEGLTTTPRMP